MVENGDVCAGPASPRSEFRQRPARSEARQRSPEGADCTGADGDPSSGSLHKFWHRAGWLVLLLMCQSTSSVILEHFEALIRSHPVVIYFLTMLVGAGGNAGSQSTVLVVRQLAIAAARGEQHNGDRWGEIQRILSTEVFVGARLAVVLFAASFLRCIIFQVHGVECLAICLSMLCIVFTSTLLGAALPLVLNRFGFDPAHAGAAIQVMMDISGVTITCIISCAVLGVRVEPTTVLPTVAPVAHASGGSRLPGIQHEGVYKLNSFGSFESPDGI